MCLWSDSVSCIDHTTFFGQSYRRPTAKEVQLSSRMRTTKSTDTTSTTWKTTKQESPQTFDRKMGSLSNSNRGNNCPRLNEERLDRPEQPRKRVEEKVSAQTCRAQSDIVFGRSTNSGDSSWDKLHPWRQDHRRGGTSLDSTKLLPVKITRKFSAILTI